MHVHVCMWEIESLIMHWTESHPLLLSLCAVGMSGGRYADRQEDELLFLREVFRSDLEDLREKDPWKVRHSCMSLFNESFCV